MDMPVVRSIMRGAAKNNYAMQSIVLGIVQSSAFQMRTKINNTSAAKAVTQTAAKE
jgi:hypothetical protein